MSWRYAASSKSQTSCTQLGYPGWAKNSFNIYKNFLGVRLVMPTAMREHVSHALQCLRYQYFVESPLGYSPGKSSVFFTSFVQSLLK